MRMNSGRINRVANDAWMSQPGGGVTPNCVSGTGAPLANAFQYRGDAGGNAESGR